MPVSGTSGRQIRATHKRILLNEHLACVSSKWYIENEFIHESLKAFNALVAN